MTAARGGSTPEARAALSELCERYWFPLYAYIRRRGYSVADAEDLTQEFFAQLLEKNRLALADSQRGRFRSFLLSSLNHYLADERDRSQARKRMPEGGWIPLDVCEAERRLDREPVDRMDPERLYLANWAVTVIERSLKQLEQEYERRGRGEVFSRLKGFVLADPDQPACRAAAKDLEISEALVRLTVARMRRRLQALGKEEVASTVSERRDVVPEMDFLLRVLRP